MIDQKDIKLSLWYPIKEERKTIIKKQISRILNELIYPHLFNIETKFTDEEMKEIVMNLRPNLSHHLAEIKIEITK